MNIKNKLRKALIVICCFGAFSSCTKDFDTINTDPNLITEKVVKINGLFTQVVANGTTGTMGGRISEFVNYTNPGDGARIFSRYDYDGFYSGFYKGLLNNISEIIRLTKDNPNFSNKNAIAKIYGAWIWQNLTDRFGDIPFSEAVQGFEKTILQPKYDDQESIYKQLFSNLKDAAAQLSDDPTKESYGDADLIYGGDVDKWKRFANSLRLRMAIRVKYKDQALAQSNIGEVINGPLITTDDQSAKLLSEANASVNQGYYNPFRYAVDISYTNGLRLGFTPVELLVTKNDPRLTVYLNPSELGGIWRGAPVNLGALQKTSRYQTDSLSLVGNFFRTGQFRFNIISAAEVSFLKAEAALSGLGGSDAQSLYIDGIQKAMAMYNVSSGAVATYLSSAAGTLTGSDENKLKQIIEEKFIAIMFQSDEAWAEYRRTGYPLIWIGNDDTDTGDEVPRRLTYPFQEYLINEASVTEATGRLQGGDKLSSRVWWDAKSGLPYQHPKQGTYPPESW
ncbi:MAG: SusD/RagB family nutrient-binding outer membrane lipoprotein [Chitinophagaceae bacterium]|nr:SusD/RagB family nutrient-binding outer membrane lipoprotein [Chitinophagaceae bacterium]